ncbi:MAG: DUF4932 domain-containing protein [Candidatus Aminicenantes bacterium]|nr:DUF4932 domain-containing protein [Candidatus Aminicenantes bacterium]
MRNFKILSILALVAVCQMGFTAKEKKGLIPIEVDPRTELFSIIFYLADSFEYKMGRVPGYEKDIKTYFDKYKNHKAVKLARQLRKSHSIGYNAPMALAVYVTDAYSLSEKVPFNSLSAPIEPRWTTTTARSFLSAAREFVKDTNFKNFIKNHHKLYKLSVSRMEKVLQKYDVIDWLNSFYGKQPGSRFAIILNLVNGPCCYGASTFLPNGSKELYSILGVWLIDDKKEPRFDSTVVPTIIHEFCHSYCNPIIDKYETQLKNAGGKIFSHVKQAMASQAYPNWKIMMYEYLVRASEIRFIKSKMGSEATKKRIQKEIKNHFFWIEELSNLLEEYELQRKKYSNLDQFFPKIVSFFEDYSKVFKKKLNKVQKESKNRTEKRQK